MQLILASASPRRKELLINAGYTFSVESADDKAESGVCSNCGPAELVTQLAVAKAEDVYKRLSNDFRQPALLLAADTVAECDGYILGKPKNEDHAAQILQLMSGKIHRVYTGVCACLIEPVLKCSRDTSSSRRPEFKTRVAVTTLQMDALSEEQLDGYLASGLWKGKAGAFGFQDRLGWVKIIEGSESNVVGLPMDIVTEMLDEVGILPTI